MILVQLVTDIKHLTALLVSLDMFLRMVFVSYPEVADKEQQKQMVNVIHQALALMLIVSLVPLIPHFVWPVIRKVIPPLQI